MRRRLKTARPHYFRSLEGSFRPPSSVVERTAFNRVVQGSIPWEGAFFVVNLKRRTKTAEMWSVRFLLCITAAAAAMMSNPLNLEVMSLVHFF